MAPRVGKIRMADGSALEAKGQLAGTPSVVFDAGGESLLDNAGIGRDQGVVEAAKIEAFLSATKTRQWDRDKLVRTLP